VKELVRGYVEPRVETEARESSRVCPAPVTRWSPISVSNRAKES
jgi:hypothetical protein